MEASSYSPEEKQGEFQILEYSSFMNASSHSILTMASQVSNSQGIRAR